MTSHTTRIGRVLAVLLCALPLAACASLYGASFEGQVLEEGTNKPIPNAIVIVRWAGSLPAFATATAVCVHVESATTDAEGRYRTRAWRAPSTVGPPPIVQAHVGPAPYVYKTGYEYVETEGGTSYLKPFTGSREERLRKIWSSGVQCESAGESAKNLIPLYRALYEEAKPLGVSDEDKNIINALLYELEKRELGYEAATRRMLERR